MVLQATKKIFQVIQEVSELGGMGLLSRVGREADPDEYIVSRVYEPHTVRGESERCGNTFGATGPAEPAHI